VLHDDTAAMLPRAAIPLAVAGPDGECRLVRDFAGLRPGSRALILMPIAPFRDGRESVATVVARVVG
jgi:hypothetical protein